MALQQKERPELDLTKSTNLPKGALELQLYDGLTVLLNVALTYNRNLFGAEGFHSDVTSATRATDVRKNIDEQLGPVSMANKFQRPVQG